MCRKLLEKLTEITKYVQSELTLTNYQGAEMAIRQLKEAVKSEKITVEELEAQLVKIIKEVQMYDFWFVYIVSVLVSIAPKSIYVELLLQTALYSEMMTNQDKAYIFYQINVLLFRVPELSSKKVKELFKVLYEYLKQQIRNKVQIAPRRKEERNQNQVIIMTSQILGTRHAPTHSTLERSCMLRKMGYDVAIFSTTETSQKEFVWYHDSRVANKVDEYDGVHVYNYNDEQFLFYQPEVPANTPEGMQKIINCVEELNPYFVVYVGGQSYVADIINEFCPVVSISTVFSQLPGGNTAFSMVGRKVREEEQKHSVSELVEVPFTFELNEKVQNHTREELGIPEDRFVMAVVGNRLTVDVKEDFIEYMQQVENGFLLLVGICDNYQQRVKQYPWLKDNSISLGYCTDVLGVLECADLYVNPKRLGGGFSVVEAFRAGIPTVSLAYGDVSVAAGDAFCVDTYEEMLDVIRRYQTDEVFYQEQLQKAKVREAQITDGFAGFSAGIQLILESEKFY